MDIGTNAAATLTWLPPPILVFLKIGNLKNGWFITLKWLTKDDLGVPLLWRNIHIRANISDPRRVMEPPSWSLKVLRAAAEVGRAIMGVACGSRAKSIQESKEERHGFKSKDSKVSPGQSNSMYQRPGSVCHISRGQKKLKVFAGL